MSNKHLKISLATLAVAVSLFTGMNPVNAQGGNQPQAARQAVQAPPQFDEQARTIFNNSAARYKALQSWTSDVEIVNGTRVTRKSFRFRAPEDFAVTNYDAEGNLTTASYYDSQNLTQLRHINDAWEYLVSPLPGSNEPAVSDAERSPQQAYATALGTYLPPLFTGKSNFSFNPESFSYAGTATVNGVQVDNVVATLRQRNPQAPKTTITYSIGQEDSLLHQITRVTEGGDSAYTETYSNQAANTPLPENALRFSAPADAKLVTRFSPSRVRASVGELPLPINAKDLDGKDLSLDQYKGKVVLIDFWATWCGPCISELPHLKATYAKYKEQGFDILGVSLDRTAAPLKTFVAKDPDISWRQTYDGFWDGPLAKAFNVRAIPATILIGRDGKVAAIGPRGKALEAAVEAALAKP